MKNPNYTRQMLKQFALKEGRVHTDPEYLAWTRYVTSVAVTSQKFAMPDGGVLCADPCYKALDDRLPLTLPFPVIAVEYTRSSDYLRSINRHSCAEGQWQPERGLLFAVQRDDDIAIFVVAYLPDREWFALPMVSLPRTNWLRREIDEHRPRLALARSELAYRMPESDFSDEVFVLCQLLNALACSNVSTQLNRPPADLRKARRGALPFDDYHTLVIRGAPGGSDDRLSGSDHRAPREHLRRGHIRRLPDGRNIWVNATVVAAGRGAGTVHKEYELRQ